MPQEPVLVNVLLIIAQRESHFLLLITVVMVSDKLVHLIRGLLHLDKMLLPWTAHKISVDVEDRLSFEQLMDTLFQPLSGGLIELIDGLLLQEVLKLALSELIDVADGRVRRCSWMHVLATSTGGRCTVEVGEHLS